MLSSQTVQSSKPKVSFESMKLGGNRGGSPCILHGVWPKLSPRLPPTAPPNSSDSARRGVTPRASPGSHRRWCGSKGHLWCDSPRSLPPTNDQVFLRFEGWRGVEGCLFSGGLGSQFLGQKDATCWKGQEQLAGALLVRRGTPSSFTSAETPWVEKRAMNTKQWPPT